MRPKKQAGTGNVIRQVKPGSNEMTPQDFRRTGVRQNTNRHNADREEKLQTSKK